MVKMTASHDETSFQNQWTQKKMWNRKGENKDDEMKNNNKILAGLMSKHETA
jgi:hypothetical protein